MTKFTDLGLHNNVLKAVTEQGYETPTPIQAQAIPHLLEDRDLLGIAQTGTGKTAAFALPTLDYLIREEEPRRAKRPRVLVLAPTRELASQIAVSFDTYSTHTDCVTQTVFGGVKIGRQIRNLEKGCHVLVATPGRLVDLMGQGAVKLDSIDILILDEADQMLDMGFIHDLKKILAQIPEDRQTLLFSATMPEQIATMSKKYLNDPVKVSVTPESTTAERVNQGVLHVDTANKPEILQAVLKDKNINRALIFTRTKHGADKVARRLTGHDIYALAIHGNKSQPQRTKALEAFKDGRCKVLVATDIAARGIDIDGITHVINFEMPNVAEQYVHRIGRTARAGRDGMALSLVAEDELYYLREVEKITRVDIDVLNAPEGCEDLLLPTPAADFRPHKPKGPSGGGRRGGGGQQRSRQQGQGRSNGRSGTSNSNSQSGNGGKPKPQRRRNSSKNRRPTKAPA